MWVIAAILFYWIGTELDAPGWYFTLTTIILVLNMINVVYEVVKRLYRREE